MNLSYIATDLEELMFKAAPEIKAIIKSDEIDKATAILGKLHKIPISSYLALSNLILFILLGALKPEDAVRGIMDMIEISEEDAVLLAKDLDKTILEKARISLLGKSPKDLVTLSFKEGPSPDELRKEILDTTQRDQLVTPMVDTAAPATPVPTPSSPITKKPTAVAGSRSQLMEQLKLLDDIPNDDEITERLKQIQQQVTSLDKKDERALESHVALEEFMPKDDSNVAVVAEAKAASYSKAPTKYNVDPYRELADVE